MSLNEHVAQNRVSNDARTQAETALLDAITEQVASLQKDAERSGVDYTTPRLLKLAEAYALVVHGTKE
jgi:hypothetical protein